MNIYQELGVNPLINASGHMTPLGGSIMDPQVLEAMVAASRHFVDLHELHQAAGRRIAEMVGVEAAHVCACASAGITLMAAACMAGTDLEKIARLPDPTGMKNKFIVHQGHRNPFDHAVHVAGGRFVEISPSVRELKAALDDDEVAAVYYTFTVFFPGKALELRDAVKIAKEVGVPVIVDAAAQVPPIENLSRLVEEGADLVVFSGGKSIRGPQSSGIILGQEDLIKACAMNDSPNVVCIGRGMKAAKEEIVGLVKAVELYYQKDHAAEMRAWERRVASIMSVLSEVNRIRVKAAMPPGIGYLIPYVSVYWDEKELGFTHRMVTQELLKNEPPIAVRLVDMQIQNGNYPQIWLHVNTLQEGEAGKVAHQVRKILKRLSSSHST